MKRMLWIVCLLMAMSARSQTLTWNAVNNELTYGKYTYRLVTVPGGWYTLGATGKLVKDAQEDENPAHRVDMIAFFIGQDEVPQWLWKAVMGFNPSHFVDDELPVETVSWNDCQQFISRLSNMTGMTFRLPTEAEWEYAAREAKPNYVFLYSGGDALDNCGWYKDNSGGRTHKDRKCVNGLNLYNMTGNVWEWCEDLYTLTYNRQPTDQSRVFRGGSYTNIPRGCRVSQRNFAMPDEKNSNIGLRLAADIKLLWDASTKELRYGPYVYKMIYVEGGRFKMGNNNGEEDEKPVHTVTLDSYYIGESEVPQWLWTAVMESNPSKWIGDNLPVEQVSWNDCQTFISTLNSVMGTSFRLPTEAQWEFAARGGNRSKGYPYSGSKNIDEVAWHKENSDGKTHPIKEKKPNELGIYDMTGNVWEWCQDWDGTYSSSSQRNPTGPSSGNFRVTRGGSWDHRMSMSRVSQRPIASPTNRSYTAGLRLAH